MELATAAGAHQHHHHGETQPQAKQQQQQPDPELSPLLPAPPSAQQGQHGHARADARTHNTSGDACFWLLMGAVAGMLGLVLVADGCYAAWEQAAAMSTWPPVPAVITGTEVAHFGVWPEGGYRASVYFNYTVAGVQYNDSMPTFSEQLRTVGEGGKSSLEGLVAMFPAGTRTTAYYDPAGPGGRAFLLRDLDTWPYIAIGLGLTVALMGVFALFTPREAHANPPPVPSGTLPPRAPRGLRDVALFAAAVALFGGTPVAALHWYLASGGAIVSLDALRVASWYLVVGLGPCAAAGRRMWEAMGDNAAARKAQAD